MAATEAQKRATKKYQQTHKDRTGYQRLKRTAISFVSGPRAGGRTQELIESGFARDRYLDDLKRVQEELNQTIAELEKNN